MELVKTMELMVVSQLRLEDQERFWLYDVLAQADISDYPPDVKRFIEKTILELKG